MEMTASPDYCRGQRQLDGDEQKHVHEHRGVVGDDNGAALVVVDEGGGVGYGSSDGSEVVAIAPSETYTDFIGISHLHRCRVYQYRVETIRVHSCLC